VLVNLVMAVLVVWFDDDYVGLFVLMMMMLVWLL
jgi:hypothetical protein